MRNSAADSISIGTIPIECSVPAQGAAGPSTPIAGRRGKAIHASLRAVDRS